MRTSQLPHNYSVTIEGHHEKSALRLALRAKHRADTDLVLAVNLQELHETNHWQLTAISNEGTSALEATVSDRTGVLGRIGYLGRTVSQSLQGMLPHGRKEAMR